MASLSEIQADLAALDVPQRFAFATLCAERCFNDMKEYGEVFFTTPNFFENRLWMGKEFCWHRLENFELSYGLEVEALHRRIGDIIPSGDDEADTDTHPVIVRVAYAISETLMILKDPSRSARTAALAGSEVIYLRTTIFSDGIGLKQKEYDWQRHAISILHSMRNVAIEKSFMGRLGDYSKGHLIEWE